MIKQTAEQVKLRRKANKALVPNRNNNISYSQQQELYFESIGVFKGNTERRDARYVSDIKYIQGIAIDDISDSWKVTVSDVLKQHNNVDIKKNARYKAKVIKTIYDFKKQKEMHDNALEKILFSLRI